MKNVFFRVIKSYPYRIIKRVLTLDNDKRFLVSSLSYYLIISLVPLITLVHFLLGIFKIPFNYVFYQTSLNINNIDLLISGIVSVYISSKGILNYFVYINDKFELNSLPFSFVSNRFYAIVLTLFICFVVALLISLNYYVFSLDIFVFQLINLSGNFVSIFITLLLLNFFLLRRKVELKFLCFGSFISAILVNSSSFIYQYYLSIRSQKVKYYGNLTDVIILLIFINLIAYFIAIGNQINFMTYKKEVK